MTGLIRTAPAMGVFWATIVLIAGWKAALVVVIASVLALLTAVLSSAGDPRR